MEENNINIGTEIKTALSNADINAISKISQEYPEEELIDIIESQSTENIGFILNNIEDEYASELLRMFDNNTTEDVLTLYNPVEISSKFLTHLKSDDAVDIINLLSTKKAEETLSYIDEEEFKANIISMLHYNDDVAGGLMAKEIVVASADWTVSQCIDEIRTQAEEIELYVVYAVNSYNKLIGTIALKDLILAKPNSLVSKIVDEEDLVYVNAYTPAEEVAEIIRKYDLVSLPVVDSLGRLTGKITVDDVVDYMQEEAEKDYQMLSGLSDGVEPTDSVWFSSRARLPWLLIGLVGGIGSSALVANYGNISDFPKMAFFMPLVAAMGGNAGVQSSSIVVQSLASGNFDAKKILNNTGKELLVALLNGLICSAIMLIASTLIGYEFDLSITVSIALLAVIIFASTIGTLIPLVLDKYKIDPALATGPFITTLNDISGLGLYFLIGSLLLH